MDKDRERGKDRETKLKDLTTGEKDKDVKGGRSVEGATVKAEKA